MKSFFILLFFTACALGNVSLMGGAPTWKPSVANIAALPSSGNSVGDARVAQDSGLVYGWDGNSWENGGGNPFNQDLNTTDTPSFAGITVAGLIYPVADGTAWQVLSTDGANNLTFVDPPNPFDQNLSTTDSPSFAGITVAGLIYPVADGTNGQVLSTDGANNLTFVDPPNPFNQNLNIPDSPSFAGITVSGIIYPLTDGTNGQFLSTDGVGNLTFVSGGSISGSTGATDNALLRADGTGGSTLQNSSVTLSDAGSYSSTLSGTITTDVVGMTILNNTGGNTQVGYADGSGGNWGVRSSGYSAENSTAAGATHGGGAFLGSKANYVYGAVGIASEGVGSNPRLIGTQGSAGTGGTPSTAIGGFFELAPSNNYTVFPPSGIISALYVTNNAQAQDIARFADDSTVVMKIADGGIITLGATSENPKHILNTDTGTTGADALTLANGPTGTAGNAVGYVKITINGTDRYIPFW